MLKASNGGALDERRHLLRGRGLPLEHLKRQRVFRCNHGNGQTLVRFGLVGRRREEPVPRCRGGVLRRNRAPGRRVPGRGVPGRRVPGRPVPEHRVPGRGVPGRPVPEHRASAYRASGYRASGYRAPEHRAPVRSAARVSGECIGPSSAPRRDSA
jgi:hypothetical protein